MTTAPKRRRVVWAVLGAVVLVGAALALLFARLGAPGAAPTSAPTTASGPSGTSAPTTSGGRNVVDPGVASRGWVPEPITRDPDVYARAALEAAGSVDTGRSTRSEWVSWLGTWFTPSPLYDRESDALDQMAGYKTELDQSVVLPQQMWDQLASSDGRVTAHVKGDIDYLQQPDAALKHVSTATAEVVMTYTRTDEGQKVTYDETVRVSVQVVCGGKSIPTAGSDQRAGDCKVVRFFDAAVG